MANKKANVWIWTTFILLLILVGGYLTLRFHLVARARDWWRDYRNLDEDETDDDGMPEPNCVETFKLGQDCSLNIGCCEEGTSCTTKFYNKQECEFIYPVCEPILPWNYVLDGTYTYEQISDIFSLSETTFDFYLALNGDNEYATDYAIELEQCMENHPEYVDYCCQCPSGTTTRFGYVKDRDIQYMWCFPNPN